MRRFGSQCQRVLFREVRILGDAAFTCNLLTTNMVSGHQSPRVTRVQGVNTREIVWGNRSLHRNAIPIRIWGYHD